MWAALLAPLCLACLARPPGCSRLTVPHTLRYRPPPPPLPMGESLRCMEGALSMWAAAFRANSPLAVAPPHVLQYLEKGGRFGRKQCAAKGCNDPIRCYG